MGHPRKIKKLLTYLLTYLLTLLTLLTYLLTYLLTSTGVCNIQSNVITKTSFLVMRLIIMVFFPDFPSQSVSKDSEYYNPS